MGCKVIILCFYLIFASVRAIDVNLTKVWKQDIGWQISCSWALSAGESLQSVKMNQNYYEFLNYRPETHRDKYSTESGSPIEGMRLSTTCAQLKQKGSCVLTTELSKPQKDDFTISCEVSEEAPRFNVGTKNILVEKFVPPTDALIQVGSISEETGRVTLNCTASGEPLPNLSWTIGEQKIPHDFSGGAWNAKSKLWQAWSAISFTSTSGTTAVCTPETSRGGKVVKGHSAQYNSAKNMKGGLINMMIATIISLTLLL